MADAKVSGLSAITTTEGADLLVVVDVSDTSMAATGTNKKITAANAFGYSPDNPGAWVDAFGAVSAYDCEFARTTNPTGLPTNWVYQNQNSATYVEQLGKGIVSIASGFNSINQLTCVVQPVSAASAYTAVGKVTPTNDAAVTFTPGLVLTDGTKAIAVWTTADLGIVSRWSNITSTYVDNIGSVTCPDEFGYYKIKKNSASSYDFFTSRDGTNWLTLLTGYDVGAYLTPTHFGFMCRQPAGACTFCFDWFRVR